MIKNICKKMINICKKMINFLRNKYLGSINENFMITCDDGDGPYERKYGDLVKELKEEYDNYEEAIKNDLFHNTRGKEIIINGIKCWINFFGTHYCGYVRDKKCFSIDFENLDYEAHGGYTDAYGFDCAHAGDIILINYNALGFPYEPNQGFIWYEDISSFKTRKFVIKELEKITNAIIKYKITNN